MAKILIIQAHPDGAERHLCHALADAYAEGRKTAAMTFRGWSSRAWTYPS